MTETFEFLMPSDPDNWSFDSGELPGGARITRVKLYRSDGQVLAIIEYRINAWRQLLRWIAGKVRVKQ